MWLAQHKACANKLCSELCVLAQAKCLGLFCHAQQNTNSIYLAFGWLIIQAEKAHSTDWS